MQDVHATCTTSTTLSDLCWRWLDTLACQTTLLVSAAKEGNAVSLWRALGRIRKRQGMVLVRETCEYHSRGEEYMVLFWRDLWVPQQTSGI